jgi:signal transduction histidine kinase
MKGLRLALLLVTLGLGVPVAGLVWRALDGLSLERAVQHQVVADRAFDAMEAELSRFLQSEEARPFEHYRFYVRERERSPLAEAGPEPFVVGAFQIDPDGSVHTPLRPRDIAAAKRQGDWPGPDGVEDRIARVTAAAGEFRRVKPELSRDKNEGFEARIQTEKDAPSPQDPGTTQALGGPLAKAGRSGGKKDAGEAFDEDTGAYEVLQRFNRAADSRSERKVQVAKAKMQKRSAPQTKLEGSAAPQAAASEPYASAPSSLPAPSPVMDRADHGFGMADAIVLEEQEQVQAEVDAIEEAIDAPARYRQIETPAAEPPEESLSSLRSIGYLETTGLDAEKSRDVVAGSRESELVADDAFQLALEPMVGRAVGDGSLLLYRTVLVGQQGYRQGLVLDRAELGAWLSARALGSTGLLRIATLDFADVTASVPVDGYAFQHRFAEPFDAVTARLHLPSLPDRGGAGTIYALVGLLALVGLAGLFAIHHMASVVVGFAERRSNFVAAVTHELKTPLTSIRMYAEMLRDGLVPTDAKRDEYYGTITDESERLSRLIDNVLEFSRLERGTREMNLRVGAIGPLLEESVERLRAHARSEGFELESEIDPDLPPIRFDRDALLQVIYNLVDNAMKYAASAASRQIRLEARRRDGGVELAVRDFGPGVSGRHLGHVFEPFYRGEDELTRETKGTGIGLSLVKELGERMGARVRGANAEGGGFRVGLWFAPASSGRA